MIGYGLIAGSLINSGTVGASNNSIPGSSTGGDLEIQGSLSGSGSITIEPGATLQIDGSLGASQSIVFSPGAPETLKLGLPSGTISNPISNFNDGDKIEFSNGITVSSVPILNGNTLAIVTHNSIGTVGLPT